MVRSVMEYHASMQKASLDLNNVVVCRLAVSGQCGFRQ